MAGSFWEAKLRLRVEPGWVISRTHADAWVAVTDSVRLLHKSLAPLYRHNPPCAMSHTKDGDTVILVENSEKASFSKLRSKRWVHRPDTYHKPYGLVCEVVCFQPNLCLFNSFLSRCRHEVLQLYWCACSISLSPIKKTYKNKMFLHNVLFSHVLIFGSYWLRLKVVNFSS